MSKTHGTIAAGHQKTAEAGIEIFRLGGNVLMRGTSLLCY